MRKDALEWLFHGEHQYLCQERSQVLINNNYIHGTKVDLVRTLVIHASNVSQSLAENAVIIFFATVQKKYLSLLTPWPQNGK